MGRTKLFSSQFKTLCFQQQIHELPIFIEEKGIKYERLYSNLFVINTLVS